MEAIALRLLKAADASERCTESVRKPSPETTDARESLAAMRTQRYLELSLLVLVLVPLPSLLLSLLLLAMQRSFHCNVILPSIRRNAHWPDECCMTKTTSCRSRLQCHASRWLHADQLRIALQTQELENTSSCKAVPVT